MARRITGWSWDELPDKERCLGWIISKKTSPQAEILKKHSYSRQFYIFSNIRARQKPTSQAINVPLSLTSSFCLSRKELANFKGWYFSSVMIILNEMEWRLVVQPLKIILIKFSTAPIFPFKKTGMTHSDVFSANLYFPLFYIQWFPLVLNWPQVLNIQFLEKVVIKKPAEAVISSA